MGRYICNWGLARCQQYYRQHGKSKPWAELSVELTRLKQTQWWLYDFGGDDMVLEPPNFLVRSDGEEVRAPRYYRVQERKQRRAQRHLSRN